MKSLCYLKCLKNRHTPIPLPHNEEIIIGRSKITQIKDPTCSRQQLSLKADCENNTVTIRQLGVNSSGLDGFSLIKNKVYNNVSHGAHIEVLLNNYIHVVHFETSSEKAYEASNDYHLKRKLNDDEGNVKMPNKIFKIDSNNSNECEPCSKDSWDKIDNGELYTFTSAGVLSRSKVAAYDMDGTLIKTKSGKVYPVNTEDWQIAFPEVKWTLSKYFADKFKIVIFTNQAPIGKGKVKIEDFKKKMEGVIRSIGVPVQAFISTGKVFYRKPATGMWDALVEMKNDGLPVIMKESFFCGDAAGRVANWAPGKKKDHSLADRLFAENLGLKFYTPETHFLSIPDKAQWNKPEFNPKEMKDATPINNLIIDKKEVVVMVGYPGSGKSKLASKFPELSKNNYKVVCRDKLGSWQKCLSEATKNLEQGKSVVIDCTNPDAESRSRWIAMAKQKGVPCRCLTMTTTFAHAKHNNKFRELTDSTHMQVTDIIFHTFKNKFQEPTVAEGFSEVVKVPFIPEFESDQLKTLYYMHLLEK